MTRRDTKTNQRDRITILEDHLSTSFRSRKLTLVIIRCARVRRKRSCRSTYESEQRPFSECARLCGNVCPYAPLCARCAALFLVHWPTHKTGLGFRSFTSFLLVSVVEARNAEKIYARTNNQKLTLDGSSKSITLVKDSCQRPLSTTHVNDSCQRHDTT